VYHHFDEDIALEFGIDAALVFDKIVEWIRYSKSTNEHHYTDHWWCKQDAKGIAMHLPFYSETQVRNIVKKLMMHGLIERGKFSKNKWDHTNWFRLIDETLLEMGSKPRESLATRVKKQEDRDKKREDLEQTYTDQNYVEFYFLYPRHISKKPAWRCWKTKMRKKTDPQKLILAAVNYAKLCRREERHPNKIMHPTTFLGPDDHWEDYLELEADVAMEQEAEPMAEYVPDKVEITDEERAEGSELAKDMTRRFKK